MRMFIGGMFALTVLVLGTAATRADDKGENRMVPEEGAIEVMLLRQRSVREDLKLSQGEANKIDQFTRQQWTKAKEIAKLPEAQHDSKFKELAKENDHFIDENLTKEQRHRLKEIELQVAGLLCLSRSEIARQLKLTDEQKKRVVTMQKEGRQELEDVLYTTRPEERTEKMAELRRTSRAKMLELLDDDQEKTWAQMQGKAFKGEFEFGARKNAAAN